MLGYVLFALIAGKLALALADTVRERRALNKDSTDE